jgi:hypothetical protein
MSRKLGIPLAVAIFLLVIGVAGFVVFNAPMDIPAIRPATTDETSVSSTITEAEARIIAEKACIKGGEAVGKGSYNPHSSTWWFDANLNATQAGCFPACVVDEKTQTAQINWRCTGVVAP